MANRLGCAGLVRLAVEAGPAAAARAAWLAAEGFGLPEAADGADAAPAPAEPRLEVLLALRRLQEERGAGPARQRGGPDRPDAGGPAPGPAALAAAPEEGPAVTAWRAAGLPERAVALAAAAPRLAAAPTVLRLAAETGAPAAAAAAAWAAIGATFRIEALRQAAAAAPAPGAFGPRARAALLEDLGAAQARLAAARLRGQAPDPRRVAQLAQEAALAGDLAAIGVAARALRAMA